MIPSSNQVVLGYDGSPDADLEAAKSAAVLVVGSQGHGLARGSLTGSVSQHVARYAACPVVVVRPLRQQDAGRIVVGVDGSGESESALRFACHRAAVTGEEVVVVNGYGGAWGAGVDPIPPFEAHPGKDVAERLLAGSVAGMRADFPRIAITTEAVPSPPERLLVDCSQSASLVVVGPATTGGTMTHNDTPAATSHPLSPEQAREAVTEAILRIVPDAELESIGPDTPLRAELELDSLDFLSFVELLSNRTGVRIDEVEYPRLATMATCTAFLSSAPETRP